jgi:hypothetical protein
MDITQQRLINQRLARTSFKQPHEVVAWLGAVQAQDYLGALWAVGLRLRKAVEADIEQAIADRAIVRTWPMRGTLHFVAPADVRWMLQLLTPRIVARNAARLLRQYDLDEATFARSKDVFIRALQGGRVLTRDGMYQALEAAHIPAANQRGLHIVWRLAQEGLLCFGPRAGKQPTFVLLDEWIPPVPPLAHDEALAELARRYFTSHGPATVADFTWWSGLNLGEARTGLDLVKAHFKPVVIDDQIYWAAPGLLGSAATSTAYVLPAFDEFTVAYRDRSQLTDKTHTGNVKPTSFVLLSQTIVINGKVVGTWKRTLKKDALHLKPNPFIKLTSAEAHTFASAAERYGAFLGLPVVLV